MNLEFIGFSQLAAFFLLPSTSAVTTRSPSNTGRREISGKALREHVPKPKPFNYEKHQFNNFW